MTRFIRHIAWCLLLLMHQTGPVRADAAFEINQLRLAMLFRITQFTIWDDGAFLSNEAPIEICFYGKGAEELSSLFAEAIGNKSSQGRRFKVTVLSSEEELKSTSRTLEDCHVVYLTGGAFSEESVPPALQTNALVITDTIDSLNNGGTLALVDQNGKLQLFLNKSQLARSKHALDSRLLNVAREP